MIFVFPPKKNTDRQEPQRQQQKNLDRLSSKHQRENETKKNTDNGEYSGPNRQ